MSCDPNAPDYDPTLSMCTPAVLDPKQQQITLLQAQLVSQQQATALALQKQQQDDAAASAASQASIQQQLSAAQTSASSTVWQSVSNMNLNNVCSALNKNSADTKASNSPQVISKFSDINVSQMCAANPTFSGVGVSTSSIQTSKLSSDKVAPYCNAKAISSASYQTEQCVCNQFSAAPILHVASSSGILGSTTGYYCSAN